MDGKLDVKCMNWGMRGIVKRSYLEWTGGGCVGKLLLEKVYSQQNNIRGFIEYLVRRQVSYPLVCKTWLRHDFYYRK